MEIIDIQTANSLPKRIRYWVYIGDPLESVLLQFKIDHGPLPDMIYRRVSKTPGRLPAIYIPLREENGNGQR